MTTHATTYSSASYSPFRAVFAWLRAAGGFIVSNSTTMACAREAERLMQLSDHELARKGLTRDRIVHHAFARYMGQ